MTGALWWDRFRGLHQLDTLQARREEADGGGYFRATSVKLMLDGVCETFTAAMGEPYLDGHGNATGHAGSLFIEPDELAEVTGSLADLGFQLHFHAIGDRAVTAALDALAALPDALRASGRHHIAHLQFVRPADLERFAAARRHRELPAAVGLQGRAERPAHRAVRRARSGPTGSTGSARCSGSAPGWRSAATGRCRAPTRCRSCTWRSTGCFPPGSASRARPRRPYRCCAAEAIAVDAAVDAFTRGVAYVNHEEDVAGTLEPGKVADVAVLDQDLFTIAPSAIGDTSVALTIASGQVVHGDE